MGEQKQFDWPRAAKLHALERVTCPGGAHVKSLLKALDAFARDKATCTETLKRISVSMGVSISTAKRARAAAVTLGVLTMYGSPTDGRSNTYQINWNVVFALPDGINAEPRSSVTPTPVKLTRDPGQPDLGPRSSWTGTPVNLTGAHRTDRLDKENATVRPAEDPSDGGEGGLRNSIQEPEASRPSGWWAWSITRKDLTNAAEMVKFFKAAVSAGIISDTAIDRVRFVALTLHASAQDDIRNHCGYLVKHLERGTWNYLSRDSVKAALKLLAADNVVLTADQIQEVRKPVQSISNVG